MSVNINKADKKITLEGLEHFASVFGGFFGTTLDVSGDQLQLKNANGTVLSSTSTQAIEFATDSDLDTLFPTDNTGVEEELSGE